MMLDLFDFGTVNWSCVCLSWPVMLETKNKLVKLLMLLCVPVMACVACELEQAISLNFCMLFRCQFQFAVRLNLKFCVAC